MNVFYSLINKGNTIVVIEHNLEIIRAADFLIDLGPGGGKDGGKILYQGDLAGIMADKQSLTGCFLKKKIKNVI